MEQANSGNPLDKSGTTLSQENNKSFTTHLPYKVARYFSMNIPIYIHRPTEKLTDKESLIEEMGNKFYEADDYSSRIIRFVKKIPIDLSYAEIDTFGKSELAHWITGSAFTKISVKDPESNSLFEEFDKILGKLEDDNNYSELGRLLGRFVFSNGLEPKYLEFSENFLKLNSAFVQAGGKDNQGLTGLFTDVIKNYKTPKPRHHFAPTIFDIKDEIKIHQKRT